MAALQGLAGGLRALFLYSDGRPSMGGPLILGIYVLFTRGPAGGLPAAARGLPTQAGRMTPRLKNVFLFFPSKESFYLFD